MPGPTTPTLPPPPGGDQDRGWQLLAVHCTFTGIVTLLLFARLYTRVFIVREVGLDDYFIILGVVSEGESFDKHTFLLADY